MRPAMAGVRAALLLCRAGKQWALPCTCPPPSFTLQPLSMAVVTIKELERAGLDAQYMLGVNPEIADIAAALGKDAYSERGQKWARCGTAL